MRPHRTASTALAAAAWLAIASTGFSETPAAATGSISGKVTEPTGRPAAGVVIRLSVEKPKTSNSATHDNAAGAEKKKDKADAMPTTTTDETGAFKLDGLAPGRYVVNAKLKGVGTAKGYATVTAGNNFPVVIRLRAVKKAT